MSIRNLQMYGAKFVICPECEGMHYEKNLIVEDIGSSLCGRDIIYYICPVTEKDTKAEVHCG